MKHEDIGSYAVTALRGIPKGYTLAVVIRRESVSVRVRYPGGNEVCYPTTLETLAENIAQATADAIDDANMAMSQGD